MKFQVESQPVSIHIPLHRVFSRIVAAALNAHKLPLSQVFSPLSDVVVSLNPDWNQELFFMYLLEAPLRVKVLWLAIAYWMCVFTC